MTKQYCNNDSSSIVVLPKQYSSTAEIAMEEVLAKPSSVQSVQSFRRNLLKTYCFAMIKQINVGFCGIIVDSC